MKVWYYCIHCQDVGMERYCLNIKRKKKGSVDTSPFCMSLVKMIFQTATFNKPYGSDARTPRKKEEDYA